MKNYAREGLPNPVRVRIAVAPQRYIKQSRICLM